MTRSDAHEALLRLDERQRLLRTAYSSARYGWPETHACAWHRRPETFEDADPGCRVLRFLEAHTLV
jgi:hypothetical protein